MGIPEGVGCVVAVAAGSWHTCLLQASGRLWCFGRNREGQCDVPSNLKGVTVVAAGSRHTCVLQANGEVVCFGDNRAGQCSVPPGLGRVIAVAAGDSHTCVLQERGGPVCFGSNFYGQCNLTHGDQSQNVPATSSSRHQCNFTPTSSVGRSRLSEWCSVKVSGMCATS